MDHKYRVEDHRIQAEELERIAAKLEAIELEVISSQRSHNALLGASRDLITDQYHRMVLRLDALTTLVEELVWRPEPRKKRWWWS